MEGLQREFDFLVGLNKELNEVWCQILGKESLPSIREIFFEVQREESRQKVMLGEQQSSQSKISALVIHGGETFQPNDQRLGKRGDRPWCDHCRKWGHTRDTCWKIHGKPPIGRNLRLNRNSKAYHSESKNLNNQTTTSPFTKEQLEVLKHLLNPQMASTSVSSSPNADPSPSCSLAQSGRTQYPFSALANSYKPWIIDSGATDHMTGSSTSFTTYVPCVGNMKVWIVDGSYTPVAGKGTISLTKTFSLESVLHVPNLSCNLLSISKLTRDLNCVAKFSSTSVVF